MARKKTLPPIEVHEDEAEAAIVIKSLRNQFGQHVVHDNLDLTVKRGEILGVVGGSGAGKTVMLRSILGLQQPAAGDIRLMGHRLNSENPDERRRIQARTGVLFQSGALFSTLSVAENIMAPMAEFTNLNVREMRAVAMLKLQLVGLPSRAADLMPSELSGGMIKRAALARALALDAELLFLDEPTAGLDPISAAAFDTLIKELASSLGLTVFMITHDLDSLYAICTEIAVLADKKVVAKAPVSELEKSTHPWIHEYFNGPRGRVKA